MVADEKSENMAKTLQEVAEAYQLPIGFVATGGSSDANNTSEMGVPVLDGCGPCGGNLHSDAEFLLLSAGFQNVVMTGRSDYPNQINNVLCFPGMFRGAFDVRASDINEEMKMAAAHALADLVSEEELCADYIIPAAFDKRVGPAVVKAVAEAARASGVARI